MSRRASAPGRSFDDAAQQESAKVTPGEPRSGSTGSTPGESSDGRADHLLDAARRRGHVGRRVLPLPRLRPADVSHRVGAGGRGVLQPEPRSRALQHDPLQLVLRGADPDPHADRGADAGHGASDSRDAVLRDRRRRRGPHRVPDLDRLLAGRRLPTGPLAGPHVAPQRPGLDHLHVRRPLPHRPVRCSWHWRSPTTTRTSRCSPGGSRSSTSSSRSSSCPPASPA